MSKNLLIIGAGYIGAALVEQAREAGWQVVPVTQSGDGESMAADVTQVESLQGLRVEINTPDVIVHCASSGRGGAAAYEAVFHEGVQNLQSVFSGVPIIFVSSTSVYAQMKGEEVDENAETFPTRETGKILLKTETLVLEAGGMVARLAGIYGPGRSVLIKKLLSGDAEIEEDGRRLVNQIHRDDAASALLFLAENKEILQGHLFNVSDSHPRSQKETYEGLCTLFNLPLPPTGSIDYNRKRGWTHKAVHNGKLIKAGWEPQYPDFLKVAGEIKESL